MIFLGFCLVYPMAVRLCELPLGAPFLIQWWEEESESRYNTCFSQQPILYKYGITWSDFHKVVITWAFRDLGWASLFTPIKLCCLALVWELYDNIDSNIRNPRLMSYKVLVRNKTIDILAQINNNCLSITNIDDPKFKIDRFSIFVWELLTKISSSPNVGFSTKQLFIPGEFTPFYRVLQ